MKENVYQTEEYLAIADRFSGHPLTDTHAHLDDPAFEEDREEIIRDLPRAHVTRVLSVSASMADSEGQAALCAAHPGIWYTVGVHPENLSGLTEDDMEKLVRLAETKKCAAIGEIGLDYHYEPDTRTEQLRWFRRQMSIARELGKPAVVHERDATEDCLSVLREFPGVRCVVHCFSGSVETAKVLIDMGHMISFTGILTFANARKAPEALRSLPPDRYMLETDCPYMCPAPFRGRRNDPRMLPCIALRAAEILEELPETIADRTTENAASFFRLL